MQKNNTITVALSGGSTPVIFFDDLATRYHDKIPWEKVYFFWGDERCVPYNHKESNFHMANVHLFSKISIPTNNIQRVIGENKPSLEKKRYGNVIEKKVKIINDLPSFDITILGIGDDGHTASIFPDDLNLFNSGEICEETRHPDTGQQRITITGKIINNSQNVFFLVSGLKKASIVQSLINKDALSQGYPASYVTPCAGNLEWFLDEDAASLIMSRR
ncbi:MAG: 6-phosphogluconolactonase [bacterium]